MLLLAEILLCFDPSSSLGLEQGKKNQKNLFEDFNLASRKRACTAIEQEGTMSKISKVVSQIPKIHIDAENPGPRKQQQSQARTGFGGLKQSKGSKGLGGGGGLGLRSRPTNLTDQAPGKSGNDENGGGKITQPKDDKENVQQDMCKLKSTVDAPFAVFCDEEVGKGSQISSTSSSPHSPHEKQRRVGVVDDSGIGQSVGESRVLGILAAVPRLAHGERKPLGLLPNVIKNNEDLFQAEKDDEENFADMSLNMNTSDLDVSNEDYSDDESTYASAASSSETYHTAIQPSEKELHGDLLYCVPDYAVDIFRYMRNRESDSTLRPRQGYMRKQSQLNAAMRCILVDWLVDVALEYSMGEDTLHLAVSLIDRFLSVFDIPKEKLQLVGTTAMMIAAKFEEIYPPDLSEFVYVTDDTYTKKQVMRMERIMLDSLEFQITTPTPLTFATKYLKMCRADQRTKNMAMYLCDLSLLELDMLKWLPSNIAAAAVCLANMVNNNEPWPLDLERWSGCTVKDIFKCLKDLLTILQKSSDLQQQAICEKYKDDKYCRVALLQVPDSLPEIVE